jgi:16S rRNA (cytidine1402-2'-O)-methyltransferase
LSELAKHYSEDQPRGETVLLIDRAVIETTDNTDVRKISSLVDQLEREGLDHRAALKKAARELGLSRAEAYRRLTVERGKN